MSKFSTNSNNNKKIKFPGIRDFYDDYSLKPFEKTFSGFSLTSEKNINNIFGSGFSLRK